MVVGYVITGYSRNTPWFVQPLLIHQQVQHINAGRGHCSFTKGVPHAEISTKEELAPQLGVHSFLEKNLKVTVFNTLKFENLHFINIDKKLDRKEVTWGVL